MNDGVIIESFELFACLILMSLLLVCIVICN